MGWWLAGVALAAEPDVRVHAWLEDITATGATAIVQVDAPLELHPTWSGPRPRGLDVEEAARREEVVGDRRVVEVDYRLDGPPGNYVVPGVVVAWGGATAVSPTLYLDLAVSAPRMGELADIVEPEPLRPFPWAYVGVGVVLIGVVIGGAVLAFRSGPPAEPQRPPERPDEAALRRWAEAASDPTLSDHDRAVMLSRITRDYLGAVLGFPAVAWSTTETMAHLGTMVNLPEGVHDRSKRLLRATDRIKYAGTRAGGDLIEALGADLRKLVADTRPSADPETEGADQQVRP